MRMSPRRKVETHNVLSSIAVEEEGPKLNLFSLHEVTKAKHKKGPLAISLFKHALAPPIQENKLEQQKREQSEYLNQIFEDEDFIKELANQDTKAFNSLYKLFARIDMGVAQPQQNVHKPSGMSLSGKQSGYMN